VAIYGTSKEVKLLDRRLGMLHLVIFLVVLAYVIGVRLVLEKGYQSLELSSGMVAVTLDGMTYSSSNGLVFPADQADLVQPLKEGAALFLATSKLTTPQQRLDNCTDPNYPCSADSDCKPDPPLSYGKCEGGFCERQTWCPAASVSHPPATAYTSQLEALDRLAISLIGTINFPMLDPTVLTTEDGRNARVTWSIPEILSRGGVDMVEAVGTGAVLSLVLKWSCSLGPGGSTCLPRLRVYDIGQGAGFWSQWAQYYEQLDNGEAVLRRDLHNATGIRFLISSRGNARRIDIYACVLQLFVALALLPIASALADTIMQYLFSERRHYREYKTETTPDFSDVRAKVEQLDKQTKSQQEKLLAYGDSEP